MVFASGPHLANFGTGAPSVFRADALQHCLVGRELTRPERSQLGRYAAANTQQDATRVFPITQDHHLTMMRLRPRRQGQQQLQGDQRSPSASRCTNFTVRLCSLTLPNIRL